MRVPISYELIAKVIGRGEGVTPAMAQRIETEIRYAGYIAREERLIRDIQRHENVKIPEDFDYSPIEMITLEAREKLQKIRPHAGPGRAHPRCLPQRPGPAEHCAAETEMSVKL